MSRSSQSRSNDAKARRASRARAVWRPKCTSAPGAERRRRRRPPPARAAPCPFSTTSRATRGRRRRERDASSTRREQNRDDERARRVRARRPTASGEAEEPDRPPVAAAAVHEPEREHDERDEHERERRAEPVPVHRLEPDRRDRVGRRGEQAGGHPPEPGDGRVDAQRPERRERPRSRARASARRRRRGCACRRTAAPMPGGLAKTAASAPRNGSSIKSPPCASTSSAYWRLCAQSVPGGGKGSTMS